MEKTIVFVSCVKTKAAEPRPARLLYTSPLFTFASTYAEKLSPNWYILSAKFGLIHPDQVIAPYEKTLNNMPAEERNAWAKDVLESLADIVTSGDEIIFLAGVPYREGLIPTLTKWGCNISIPMEGLSFGRQLGWLKEQLEDHKSDYLCTPVTLEKEIKTPLIKSKSGGKLSLANQIREHVLKNIIEPARQAGKSTIKVSAREVHKDLGLTSRYPAVCGALDSNLFKEQARVIQRNRSGPHQSSSVTWLFEIL